MNAAGTMKFRRVVLIFSIIFAAITILIIVADPRGCETGNLELGLWLCFSIHMSAFLLLLFHFIGLGFVLKKVGRLLGLYYFYMVGAMFATQIIFFKSKGCEATAPLLYFWVLLNIFMFYVIVAYGIALWGAYICWESEKEEEEIKVAMKKYMKKMAKEQQNQQQQALLRKSSSNVKMLKALERGTKQKLLAIKADKPGSSSDDHERR